MLISRSNSLTIHVVRKLKLAVFTWKGFTSSKAFKEGTIQLLDTLRLYPEVTRIILNTRDHHHVMHADIMASVYSTVEYLGIAKGSYKMAVLPPSDILAKNSIDWYVDSLNNTSKKRFVVKKHKTMKNAFSWLTLPRVLSWFNVSLWSA